MSEGKRKATRQTMFKVIRYTIDGRDYADLSTNVSPGGIFIKNFYPPPVGSSVALTVKLPEEWGSLPIKILGRVAHVNNDPDPHKRGMGIEFTSVIAESVPIIEYFVREVYQQDSLQGGELETTTAPSAGGQTTTYQYHITKKKEA